ncbi:MAG: hypothetical protein JWQ40_1673 [Segetibacter sp.]|nr:hypothetical protein [Segetibacter sp.]
MHFYRYTSNMKNKLLIICKTMLLKITKMRSVCHLRLIS